MTRAAASELPAQGQTGSSDWRGLVSELLAPTLMAVLTWFAARISYLFAHTLAELFSIVAAVTALVVASTSHRFTRNHFVIVAAIAVGWCASLDLVHTLVFKGMRLIDSDSANPATQLWISARFLQAAAMVVAPLMLSRVILVHRLHLLFGMLCALALAAVFSGHFPDAYIDGQGLTPFKIHAEYLIIGLLGLALLLLWQRRALVAPALRRNITLALLLMMASEFAFTRYASVYAGANLLGHVLKIYAYWFVYVALAENTLKQPFSMLARAANSYDAVPDPTLIVALDGTIQQANLAAGRRLRLPVEQLIGRSSHALFHDGSVPIEACPVCTRLGGAGQRFTQVLELPRFEFVECLIAPCVQDDAVDARVQVVRDITERHASEERFRKLFEDTRQPIMLIENGRFVAANRAALAMLRVERLDQFVGRTIEDISPARQSDGRLSSEKAAQTLAAAFEHGAHEFEWEHLRADGTPLIARVLLTPIQMRGKTVLHVVWSDITRQKQAERELDDYRQTLEQRVEQRTAELAALAESLRGANEKQQAVFDAASVGIMLTSERVITSCNRTMERLFGYPAGALIGQTTRVLYPDEASYAAVIGRLEGSLSEQGDFREERELVRRDGSRFWCRKVLRAMDRQNLGKGFAGTFEDITTERAAIEEMARARSIAEDAARTKAEFLANMSHEIRTPMNSVIGMALLALKADPSPKVRDYLQKIQSSGQHLLGVINDILDFSKLEADKMVLERADFELEQVFEHLGNLFSAKVASKGLEFVIDVAADVPPYLVGDSLRLGQVLINLVNNAVKFTDSGEIAVQVSLQERHGDAAVLRFVVRDTGIGISEAQRRHLFQSFQQADSSTTRKYGGTGLGLAICKRLIRLMGGEIDIESTVGQGSTFRFSAQFGVGSQRAPGLSVHPDLHGLRTLVVDDNEHARQVIVEMLRGMDFESESSASGEQALDAIVRADAANQPYDLVLLDWKMPQLDGLAVARALHDRPLRKPPLLMLITAYDRDEVLPQAARLGIHEVLVKPVTPSALFNSVLRQFDQADAARARPMSNADLLAPTETLLGARALLVEDNELNQEVATEFLQALGLEVELAENGEIALAKVGRQHYDIVLMDMQMPVMDGITATQAMRQRPELRDLPIVAMTANAMAGDRERCIAAGMNDHIAKPIDPDDLVHKLEQWIRPDPRRARARDATAAINPPGLTTVTPAGKPCLKLQEIEGLDLAQGLSQALGREALYLSLLKKFVAAEQDAPARIAQALAAAQTGAAERAAHTLKGVAAQIGATPMRELAGQLEQAIHQGADAAMLDPLQRALTEQLPRLIHAIAAQLPAVAPAPESPVSDLGADTSLRERLTALLEDDDATSVPFFEEHESQLRALLGERFGPVAEAISQFDLPAGLRALKAAAH